MLSWSSEETNTPFELLAVTDRSVDPLVPGGKTLLAFVDAVVNRVTPEIAEAGAALTNELGRDALVNAASVIGNFEMMNRVADGTGMPVGQGTRRRRADLIERLGLTRMDHLRSKRSQARYQEPRT
jgi:hypothetical protein